MSQTQSETSAIGAADVERIAASSDPVVRNLQITQCYGELSRAVARRLAGQANWCTFATWASKQAGQTIRGEDLERALERAFDRSPAFDEALRPVIEAARSLDATADSGEIRRVVRELLDPAGAAARASDAVARGNLKVFAEIGREFARFLAERGDDAAFDGAALAQFAAGLRAGEPPDGQRFLRQAFERYYRAFFEPGAKARAELALLANLEIGFHEQTRLQPEIRAALDAAVLDPAELTRRLVALLAPQRASWLARARSLLRSWLGGPTPLERAVAALVERVRREVRLVVTEHLMTLQLARGERVELGADLRAAFPASLTRIENAELRALLARVDPTADSVRGSGASDWGDLPERLHFIADLFRCHHENGSLFDEPFGAVQVQALKAGQRPAGPL